MKSLRLNILTLTLQLPILFALAACGTSAKQAPEVAWTGGEQGGDGQNKPVDFEGNCSRGGGSFYSAYNGGTCVKTENAYTFKTTVLDPNGNPLEVEGGRVLTLTTVKLPGQAVNWALSADVKILSGRVSLFQPDGTTLVKEFTGDTERELLRPTKVSAKGAYVLRLHPGEYSWVRVTQYRCTTRNSPEAACPDNL